MKNLKKIFGLGFGRTGTKSLTIALKALGLRCFHWSSDATAAAEVYTGSKVSHIVEYRDVIIDMILPLLYYREYTFRFPHAKFILTTRNVSSWANSMHSHLSRVTASEKKNHSDGLYRRMILGQNDEKHIDTDEMVQAFKKHNKSVRSFFADKPGRLLEMDITTGDGWEKLCPFLGENEPKSTFPFQLSWPSVSNTFGENIQRDTLSLVTLILPRMEINHLEEWLFWHYELGIRHFWIICDRSEIIDESMNQNGGQQWKKKPWANYNSHISALEARNQITKIVQKCELKLPYINIRIKDITDFSKKVIPKISKRQVLVANNVAATMINLSKWVCLIDVDELLSFDVIKRLEKILSKTPQVSTIRMNRQILMGNRFQNGQSVNYSNILTSWGEIPDTHEYLGNGKSFVRPNRGRWVSPHRAVATCADGINLTLNNLLFYHFHGLETSEKSLKLGWDEVYQWASVNRSQTTRNDHVKVLERMKTL